MPGSTKQPAGGGVIVLIRHAAVARVPKGRLLGHAAYAEWCAAYDDASFAAPPGRVPPLPAGAAVVSSDLPRARSCAELLAEPGSVRVEEILREVPATLRVRVRLVHAPAAVWLLFSRVAWACNARICVESRTETRARASEAAALLISLAQERGSVICVGHGLMNRFIANELRAQGWAGPRRAPHRTWQPAFYGR